MKDFIKDFVDGFLRVLTWISVRDYPQKNTLRKEWIFKEIPEGFSKGIQREIPEKIYGCFPKETSRKFWKIFFIDPCKFIWRNF